jgi:hypothetical protein
LLQTVLCKSDSKITYNVAFASPSFPNQEITDNVRDWIVTKNATQTRHGDRSTDIEAVDYHSDGNRLNAILWLYFPFQVEPNPLNEEVDYGMYIDADFDETTGWGGIEYKVETSWDNQTKKWSQVVEKWSRNGDELVLQNITIPHTQFSKKDAHYVRLSVDLDTLLSPERYKVIFYGDVRRNGVLIADLTRTAAVPPLELSLSTSPNFVEMRKGEPKTIEVKVNTTHGYEPTVDLVANTQSKYLNLHFTGNDTIIRSDYRLRIPSYGVATIPLIITSNENASVGPYSIFLFAKSSFPPEEFLKPRLVKKNITSFLPASVIASENIFTQSSLLVTLNEPLTWADNLGDLWSKVGGPFSFFAGLVTGHIGPWIFNKIRNRHSSDNSSSKQTK